MLNRYSGILILAQIKEGLSLDQKVVSGPYDILNVDLIHSQK